MQIFIVILQKMKKAYHNDEELEEVKDEEDKNHQLLLERDEQEMELLDFHLAEHPLDLFPTEFPNHLLLAALQYLVGLLQPTEETNGTEVSKADFKSREICGTTFDVSTFSDDADVLRGIVSIKDSSLTHGSVDSKVNRVDAEELGSSSKNGKPSEEMTYHHKRVKCVDTVHGRVDTRPRFQKTQFPDWDSVSTQPVAVSTLVSAPRRPVLRKWDSVSTHSLVVSTHSG
ncbi:hypothetical protein Taro_043320 [Colocasia esculenta]|uniref:Uncharacterized protein n=1 Tax=Colocasia esculenta TaxID=4460 RepID=A0A843X0F4_COLES|nr:hypothetical protein [Colocasia esculenta]